MFKDKTISLVLPCYNEALGLEKILRSLPSIIDEVIVVDNGSTDRSAEIAKALGAKVIIENKKGYGYAYQRGLPQATKDIIVAMDADGSYPLDAVESMITSLLKSGYDFLSGCRFPLSDPLSMPWINQKSNAFIAWFVRKCTRVDIKDLQSGMWVFRRSVLNKVFSSNTGMGFSQEIKINAYTDSSVSFGEHPIAYHPRVGQSKFRKLRDGYRCFVDALSLIKSKWVK